MIIISNTINMIIRQQDVDQISNALDIIDMIIELLIIEENLNQSPILA